MSGTGGLSGRGALGGGGGPITATANLSSRNPMIYTHHLPYGIRRDICNLLDADQSWRILGGRFFGLDATQMTLIGQAYLRNGSPTEELFNKLDSANVRISQFCFYLKQMNHIRALEILKAFALSTGAPQQNYSNHERDSVMSTTTTTNTLYTPTPSFNDIDQPQEQQQQQQQQQMALMMEPNDELQRSLEQSLRNTWFEPEQCQQKQHQRGIIPAANINQQQQRHNNTNFANGNQAVHLQQPQGCHKTVNNTTTTTTTTSALNRQQAAVEHKKPVADDPGEEIVRMACANNRKRTSISDQEVVNQLRLIMQINYTELKAASNNFSDTNILGNGGFASVYRGYWKGTDVAIKRLRCNLMDQALNELTILNSYRIDNILPIYGISIDGPEACLVYQFMSNGSLEDRLSCKKDTRPLSWAQRALIGEGVAKGLYYLHTLRDKPLVHGDVKSANVLLDSQFVPKLGDFGLARQVFKGKNPQTELCTHCTVSSIHGTSVYLPPEYLRHKILSPAVDVYSYGIVLLEMATGRRAFDGKRLLIDLVEDETRSMSRMDQISVSLKDPRLSASSSSGDLRIWFELLIKLGVNCAHKVKKKRPDIGQVLNHFADFHAFTENNHHQQQQQQLLLMGDDLLKLRNSLNGASNAAAATTTTTTRTLTPDLSTLDNHHHNHHQLARQQPKPETMDQQPNAYAMMDVNKPTQNNSSMMMSFEEDSHNQQPQQQKQQHQQRHDEPREAIKQQSPPDQQVAAMIPLLTELGLEVGDNK